MIDWYAKFYEWMRTTTRENLIKYVKVAMAGTSDMAYKCEDTEDGFVMIPVDPDMCGSRVTLVDFYRHQIEMVFPKGGMPYRLNLPKSPKYNYAILHLPQTVGDDAERIESIYNFAIEAYGYDPVDTDVESATEN
jgi:hypothetical protein